MLSRWWHLPHTEHTLVELPLTASDADANFAFEQMRRAATAMLREQLAEVFLEMKLVPAALEQIAHCLRSGSAERGDIALALVFDHRLFREGSDLAALRDAMYPA